jgi:hypothetical protein
MPAIHHSWFTKGIEMFTLRHCFIVAALSSLAVSADANNIPYHQQKAWRERLQRGAAEDRLAREQARQGLREIRGMQRDARELALERKREKNIARRLDRELQIASRADDLLEAIRLGTVQFPVALQDGWAGERISEVISLLSEGGMESASARRRLVEIARELRQGIQDKRIGKTFLQRVQAMRTVHLLQHLAEYGIDSIATR